MSDIVSVHLQALYLFGPILELLSYEVSALVFLALDLPSSSLVRSCRSVNYLGCTSRIEHVENHSTCLLFKCVHLVKILVQFSRLRGTPMACFNVTHFHPSL